MAPTSSLDVVIVSYRCRELLRDCLASLEENAPARALTVTVVDNASGDGTAEMVARDFPDVRLIASDRNLGFSAGNNLGIRAGGSTYALALNPDSRMTPGALDALADLMDARPDVGICGCKLVRDDGTLDHAAKRSFPTVLGALGHFTGVGRSRSSGPLAQYRAPEVDGGPVDAVNGAFMFMRRSTLDEIGLFDEGFWMYMEDLDLCYRCREAGPVVWYEPSVSVVHVKHGTTGDHRSPRLNYAFHYGMYRFYRKHYARSRSALTNLAVYLGIAAKLGISVVRSALGRRSASRHAPA